MGGWNETQKVEAGTVELEVSWNLKHKPVPQAVSPEQALHTLQGAEQVEQPQVEEETVSGEGSWPEPPLQWELWVPLPQEEGQVCTRRSGDLAGDNLPQLRKSEPVYTPDIELLLDALQEPLNVVHTVDPRDAERNYEKWMPAIHKEVGAIEKAVQRLAPDVRPAWLLAATMHRAPALRCTRQAQQPKPFVVLWFFVQRGVGG